MDRECQRAFVDQYSAYLFGICLRYVKTDFDAKDCLQDSLIRILSKIPLFDEDLGSFSSWISKLTANQCLTFLRKNKRLAFVDAEYMENLEVEEIALKKLELEEVLIFINELSDRYRIPLNMYVIEGYSHKEIASALEINESSSRSLVARARKILIKKFDSKVAKKKKKKKENEARIIDIIDNNQIITN